MDSNVKKNYSEGFTLIELLIVIALAGVIISLTFSFFISYLNMFNNTDNNIEIQQQGQFIMSFIEEKIIESNSVTYLEDMNGKVKHETNELVELRKIIFKNNPIKDTKGYIFQLSKDSELNTYNLKYGQGLSGTATVELGNNIEKIEVEPLPSDCTYTESKGISIKMYFRINNQTANIKNQLCFRN